MKRHLRIAVAALLVLACVGALLGFAACKDEKQASTITAESEQSFVYDGQVHNVVATLNHEEAQLQYDPQQGFTDIGTYTVTITAPETDNYYAPTPVTVTVHILDPAAIAADELADKILAGVSDFNVGDPLGVDLGVDLSYKPATGEGWGYKLGVKGTLDLENTDNTIFTIDLTDTLASEQKFALTYAADEDVIYVKAGENKYAVQNADLLSALVTSAPADTNVTMGTYLSMIIGVLGTNCTASADGNTYTMDFNLKDTLGGALGGIIGSILPENIANAIYSIFGASDWNGFVNALPELSGKIEVKFADNKLTAVSLKDVAYKYGDTTATIQANVTPFTISNTPVEVTAPADKDTYTERNLLNINAEAVLSLTTNGTSYVDYKVELMSDIDILSLLNDGANENTGKLYLRISHICNDDCGSYCAAKYSESKGSIIEIGYDSSVNATSVNIIANLKNVLGEEALLALGVDSTTAGIASLGIPDYVAITADIPGLLAKAVAFPTESEEPGEGETDPGTGEEGTTIDINAILDTLSFGTNANGEVKIDIDLATLLTTLGLDEATMGTIGVIFGNPDNESALGGISLAINSVGIFNTDFSSFDMYNTLTKVVDPSSDAVKNFHALVGGNISESVKTWTYQTVGEGDNNPKLTTDLDLSMLTLYEAENILIGSSVYFDTVALDGTQRNNITGKICGVEGIDWTAIGKEQKVNLLVSIPQTIANSTVTDALKSTLDLYTLFKTKVPATITLATASDYKLELSDAFDENNAMKIGAIIGGASDPLNATISFKKTAGEKIETGSVVVSNTADINDFLWTPAYSSGILGTSYYVTVDGTSFSDPAQKLLVKTGKTTLTYEAFGQTFNQEVTFESYDNITMSLNRTEATVGSSFNPDYTFTLTDNQVGDEPADSRTVLIKSGAKFVAAGFVTLDQEMTEGEDYTVTEKGWTYTVFPGEQYGEKVTTNIKVKFFEKEFNQDITLKNKRTTYKVAAEEPQVNGLTATVKITITNNAVGYGQDFDGTIAIRKYYNSDLEVADVTVSADSFSVANDLGGNSLTVTVTLTANKAGTGKFYIDLMNGETKVASSSTVTIEFTDPAAEA